MQRNKLHQSHSSIIKSPPSILRVNELEDSNSNPNQIVNQVKAKVYLNMKIMFHHISSS